MGSPRIKDLEASSSMVLALLILFLIFGKNFFIFAALLLLFLSLALAKLHSLIVKVWLLITGKIGGIFTKIVLSFVFFLFLTPIAFFYRLFNKNPLSLKKPNTKSLFIKRNYSYEKKDFENPW